tara:strand:- start:444 stop:725 length:282 start_codon:yes stop_codon:yes gene_type:complete
MSEIKRIIDQLNEFEDFTIDINNLTKTDAYFLFGYLEDLLEDENLYMDGEATGWQVKETKDKVRNSALFLINKGFELRLSCFDIKDLLEEVEE